MAERTTNPVARGAAFALLAAFAVLAVLAVRDGKGDARHVTFTVPTAANFHKGLAVRAAGQRVGKVTGLATVDGGRGARVEIGITDDAVWPLPTDTRLRLRYGGTVAYAQRYIDLDRGTASRVLPDGGTIATSNIEVPVEFDDVFGTFGRNTRKNLRRSVRAAGAALKPAAEPLRDALDSAPEVTRQARGLFADLGADPAALATLVRSTDDVLAAANRARPGVAGLIDDASTTFAALGAREQQLENLLQRLPGTLTEARSTLTQADGALNSVAGLATDIKPGVERLISITKPLNSTLRTLTAVAPAASSTLNTARRGSGAITTLVDEATGLMPELASLGEQATTQLHCIRPFAPEIGGFLGTWTGFVAVGDGKDKIARLFNSVHPLPNDSPFGTATASKLWPGSFRSYAFPRPPGANVNQPWFLPECGITADGLDPTKNPEDLSQDLFSKRLVDFEDVTP